MKDTPVTNAVTIRYASPRDERALVDLAELDDRAGRIARQPTDGTTRNDSDRVLVAEEDGRLVAALPLDGSPAYADPFRPTEALLTLLRARAAQLQRAPRPRRRHGLSIAHLDVVR